ncbi:MAG: acylphosphatase [Pirellulales bacterium]
MNERCTVRYSGHVQGVGFRATVHDLAARFAVAGFVQNLPNGGVLLTAEGESTELEHFLHAVRITLERYIDAADMQSGHATGEWKRFTIKY